jgi:energy-coupling factor transporter ATP-binding protein EcfA2
MKNTILIGLGGVAGCGKDTFFTHLKKALNKKSITIKRYSFGDELKHEVNKWTTNQYGIDAIGCSRPDKEKIRPFLISHGVIKRDKTEGQYWIEKTKSTIERDPETPDVACITDVRYNQYKNDEASWIKNSGGLVVYIQRLVKTEEAAELRVPLEAKNSEELKNDPLVKDAANYIASIKEVHESIIEETVDEEISIFLNWLENKGGEQWKQLLM